MRKKPCSDGEINARLLVLVHVVLKLCLAQLVEGDDDQGNKDVDEEEGKDNEEDDVKYRVFSSVPRDWPLVLIGRRH